MEEALGRVRRLECSKIWVVEESHAAAHLARRGVKVLSTPSLLLMFEVTARECIDAGLPEGYVTVGTLALVRHLSPAPVGSRVEIRVRVEGVDGGRISVYGRAVSGDRLVGELFHERRVVRLEEYVKRVAER